jgi:LPXTG-site transpeptidase (sortase) family protein
VAAAVATIVLARVVAVSGQGVIQRHAAAAVPARTAPRHVAAQPAQRPAHPVQRRAATHPAAPVVIVPYNPAVPSASIVIPRLGIHAPVYDRGVDGLGRLPIAHGYAVTHFRYSAPLGARGNYVIYGHDDIEGQIFRYLDQLRPGDRVYLHHGVHEYVYQVTGSQVVVPTQVSVLNPTSWASLTMISCTPYWVDTHRIVVRATLIGAR